MCDAIMGSGKTSAAIAYINAHPGDRFIYITPYLNEAARIREACRDADFVEPTNRNPQYQFRKYAHTCALVHDGRNITTTHASFKNYTEDTLRDIKKHGYTLIVDESVEIVEHFQFQPTDIQLLVEAGYLTKKRGSYVLLKDGYKDGALAEMFRMLQSRDLVEVNDDDSPFQWVLPPEFFTAFRDVYILTYLFRGQSLCCLLMSHGISFSYIGVIHDDTGYRFSDSPAPPPAYVSSLRQKIHILENEKLNDIGRHKCSISMNWFKKDAGKIDVLKRNIYNCFNNIWRDVPSSQKLWGSYNIGLIKLKGKGYTKLFLPFNARSTNNYRDRTHLVYAANVFMNVGERRFYEHNGVTVDEDTYALSVMVQWIWRSAIREGGEIWVYIPSKRMRTLFTDWIDTISKGVVF